MNVFSKWIQTMSQFYFKTELETRLIHGSGAYLHIDDMVPRYNVTWYTKGFHMNHVNVPSFCSCIQPLWTERVVHCCDSRNNTPRSSEVTRSTHLGKGIGMCSGMRNNFVHLAGCLLVYQVLNIEDLRQLWPLSRYRFPFIWKWTNKEVWGNGD